MTATAPIDWPVYGLSRNDKRALLTAELGRLTRLHAERCQPYARILSAHRVDTSGFDLPESIPAIPVRLFKHYELASVAREEMFRTLSSSGTSGQTPSRVVLDRKTADLQTAALVRIMQDFLGKARLPMLIVDHPGVVGGGGGFSARAAGVLGLSSLGRGHSYALRDDMSLDLAAVEEFSRKHAGQPKLLFGFTFMIWRYFVQALEEAGARVDLEGGVLMHSGGWKKLQAIAVDNATFKRRALAVAGLERVHNFYGMAEQVGSVFVECEESRLHAPAFADIIVREPERWTPAPHGRRGIIQALSCLPQSYPGHSLLTEDIGETLGEDDCPCGRLGRTFLVHGRAPSAEPRGCGDTMSAPGEAA